MIEQLLLHIAFITHMASATPKALPSVSRPGLMATASAASSPSLSPPLLPPFQPPEKKPQFVAPLVSADSALAYDFQSQTLLFEKNIHERRKIASISKLMTAIIILENHRLDEKVIIPRAAAAVEPVKIWLLPGEEITVENLLYALLIPSANDAALALAIYDSLNEEKFVAKMNGKARELGMTNTHFTNASGLDDLHAYSSAHDVLLMSLRALEFEFVRKAVRISKMEIRSANGRIKHRLETTNDLLGDKNFTVHGLKTGNTLGAGPSLVALTSLPLRINRERTSSSSARPPEQPEAIATLQLPPNQMPEILTIVLGSENRFQETKILLDWISRAYSW